MPVKKRKEPGEGSQLTREQWEGLCRQCGQCCFEKELDRRGGFIVTTTSCRYLDIVTRRCRVYHKRFETGEECLKLTPDTIRSADWIPEECAYRQLLEDHPDLTVNDEE